MRLGATITSERGKPVTKTGNQHLTFTIKNEEEESIANITVYPDWKNSGKPKIDVIYYESKIYKTPFVFDIEQIPY